uniref:Putative secreted protein n=1 Tax=Amblyomma triste TaxID=251400 RepID=A0A023G4R3_AMBTT
MGLKVWALLLMALLNLECSLAQPDGDNITAVQRGLWYVMHDHNQAMEVQAMLKSSYFFSARGYCGNSYNHAFTALTESEMYVLEVTKEKKKQSNAISLILKKNYQQIGFGARFNLCPHRMIVNHQSIFLSHMGYRTRP